MTRWYGRDSFAERIAIELAYRSGLSRAAARWHAGRGAIYMFHSVMPDPSAHIATDLRTSTSFLDRLLSHLRRSGIDILAIDDLRERLASADTRRFVIFTFDDGYADNLIHALPVFERHNAPLAIYIASGMVTRRLSCWWLALERLFLENSAIEIVAMGERWVLSGFADRARAYNQARDWVSCDVRTRAPLLAPTFARYGLSMSDIASDAGLSLDHVRTLARHSLVTIGGHTETHPELAQLSEPEARQEILKNKRFLERIARRPVEHFSYPYGGPRACSAREGRLAREAGYKTAVTTQHGCVFDRHLEDLYLLPRVGFTRSYESIGLARLQIDGTTSALSSLWQRLKALPVHGNVAGKRSKANQSDAAWSPPPEFGADQSALVQQGSDAAEKLKGLKDLGAC